AFLLRIGADAAMALLRSVEIQDADAVLDRAKRRPIVRLPQVEAANPAARLTLQKYRLGPWRAPAPPPLPPSHTPPSPKAATPSVAQRGCDAPVKEILSMVGDDRDLFSGGKGGRARHLAFLAEIGGINPPTGRPPGPPGLSPPAGGLPLCKKPPRLSACRRE